MNIRAMEKGSDKVQQTPRVPEFVVGNTITVSSWEDLERKCTYIDDGNLEFEHETYFTDAMKRFCGKKFVITRLNDDGDVTFTEDGMNWHITKGMVEKI